MKNETAWACFGVAILIPLSMIISALLDGWVFSVLWGWFIVPTFGLPKLTIVVAIGLGLVVAMLTHQETPSSEKDKEWSDIIGKLVARVIFVPLMFLAMGWIVHLFM